MFGDDFLSAANSAKAKADFLKGNPLGYVISSMLAGAYVGLGILLIFSVGGQLIGQPYVKMAMGLSFGIALSLVVIAGSELFTGNNLVMSAGFFRKTVSLAQVLKVWVVCYIGNWIGSVLIATAFFGAGFATGSVGELIAATASAKMNMDFLPLLLRAVLCNILVCLAVWCSIRCKSESGKLIMIFWCLFAFITSGFEHSVANMTLLTISLFSPFDAAISLSGYFYNIFVVTLGNMVGGILCVSLPYYLISKKKEV